MRKAVALLAKMLESGENYLETILMLERRNGTVRSTEVAAALGYTKASVSRAMGLLRQSGYINMEDFGPISLTQAGRRKAEEIYERHCLITRFLELSLGVDHETAMADACRFEHDISTKTFEKIREYVYDRR